jgi:hypothetical protein
MPSGTVSSTARGMVCCPVHLIGQSISASRLFSHSQCVVSQLCWKQWSANLLDNALRFTPHGGSTDLGVYRQEDAAILQIEDSGPGIAACDLERIFEPFFRGSHPEGKRAWPVDREAYRGRARWLDCDGKPQRSWSPRSPRDSPLAARGRSVKGSFPCGVTGTQHRRMQRVLRRSNAKTLCRPRH